MTDVIYKPSPWGAEYHALTTHEALGGGAAGPGKALALWTMAPTPRGMRAFGDLMPGDEVFDERGMPTRVTWVSDVMMGHECREVVFDDGSSVVADVEHLWLTVDYNQRSSMLRQERRVRKVSKYARDQRAGCNVPRIRTTAEIEASLKWKGKTNHAVMCAGPLQMPEASVAVDPYLLGLWLGDGSSAGGEITSADSEILDAFRAAGFSVRRVPSDPYRHSVTPGFTTALRAAGVLRNKHIPEAYHLASEAQRLALLQGLVDTDGHIDRDGRVELTLCNERLAADAYRLVGGLGFKATMRAGDAKLYGRVVGTRYRICWSPMGRDVCRLIRKRARLGVAAQRTQRWRYIVDVRVVASEPVRCIRVANASRLFLVGTQCIPTHNTKCLLMDPLQQIMMEHERCQLPKDHPNRIEWGASKGWALFLRRTTPQLSQNIRDINIMFKTLFPDHDGWREKFLTYTCPSGYRYQLGHCQETKDWENYWGGEYSWIGFDELCTFDQEQYDMISLRLRCSDHILTLMSKIRAMSNPVVSGEDLKGITLKNPQWVRDYFVEPCREGRKIIPKRVVMGDGTVEETTRIYLPAYLKDNPDPAFARRYEIQIRSSNKPHVANALINADWYINAHSYFGDVWNPRIHICRPFPIPSSWKRFRSMDWGYKVPGCIHWWAMDDDGNLFCEKEQTFEGKHDYEVAGMVKEIETLMGLWKKRRSQITGPADTQLWEERGDSSASKAEVFARMGVPWVQANKSPGSRQANAMRLHKRLGDHGHGTKQPGLVLFENCRQLIKTLPLVQETPGNPDEPIDGGMDHWFDCLAEGTLVATEIGEVAIELLTPGTKVLSTDGGYWPCLGGRFVRRAPVYRVEFEDGSAMVATGNHPVLCATGEWKRVDQLDSECYAFRPWIRSSSLPPDKIFTVEGTICAANTSAAPGLPPPSGCCIDPYGGPGLGISQPTMISTTETGTEPTTALAICSPSRSESTGLSTCERSRIPSGRPTSPRPRWRLAPGIPPPPVSSGTGFTPQRASANVSPTGRSSVSAAGLGSCSAEPGQIGSGAPGPATPDGGGTPASTTRSGYALPAGLSSWPTGTVIPQPVHGDALRVVAVTEAGEACAWCTSVPTMGAFVAEGVVVSNSASYAAAYASHGRAGIPSRNLENEDDEDEKKPVKINRGRLGYGFS